MTEQELKKMRKAELIEKLVEQAAERVIDNDGYVAAIETLREENRILKRDSVYDLKESKEEKAKLSKEIEDFKTTLADIRKAIDIFFTVSGYKKQNDVGEARGIKDNKISRLLLELNEISQRPENRFLQY